jgi:type III secretion protein S
MDSLTIFKQALWLTTLISLPPLLVATLFGVLLAVFQALTQIQDQTLPYVVKLVLVSATLVLSGRWIGSELLLLTIRCLDQISAVAR